MGCGHTFKRIERKRCTCTKLFAIAISVFFAQAMANESTGTARNMSESEVQATYQNCPYGYYTGPRPGKARYTKDNFLWAVTPEFARKFCMSQEFVSSELKGAEAVAFRIVEDADEEHCGWGGREDVCARGKELRFEIYLDAGITLPKKNDLNMSVLPRRPSALLIAKGPKEWDSINRRNAERDRDPKAQSRSRIWPAFETTQFDLNGVRDGKVVWPIVSLTEYVYNEGLFTGVNYLALQGSTGFFAYPRMEVQGVRRFFIVVRKLGDAKKSDDRLVSEFAHVIELPEKFSDQVRVADKARGLNIEELGRRALGINP